MSYTVTENSLLLSDGRHDAQEKSHETDLMHSMFWTPFRLSAFIYFSALSAASPMYVLLHCVKSFVITHHNSEGIFCCMCACVYKWVWCSLGVCWVMSEKKSSSSSTDVGRRMFEVMRYFLSFWSIGLLLLIHTFKSMFVMWDKRWNFCSKNAHFEFRSVHIV